MRPGVNGTFASWPAFFAACSIAAQPPRTIRSASETFLPPLAEALNSFWIVSRFCRTSGQLGWLIDVPIFLRRKANARAIRAAALVGTAERRRRRPGRRDELGNRQARGENLRVQSSNVLLPD